jgi:hypothetical protein
MERRPLGPKDGHRKATVAILALLGVLSLLLWRMTWVPTAPTGAAAQAQAAKPAANGERATLQAEEKGRQAAVLAALRNITDYQAAQWHPIHFKPQIDRATDSECLACHHEVLSTKVRPASPAGLKAQDATAWYQTLDTYKGDQEAFHARHLTTPMAREFMNMKCTFCHQGNDPREESPGSSATTTPASTGATPLRKMVDTSSTCLLCHGQFPAASMGLEGKWPELREGMESPENPNGCLTCHAEQFRTNRHQVNYLKPEAIEVAAKTSADVCYGCHGGRAWYRTTYAYPRHPWPGMDTSAIPDWAKGRPAQSRPEHLVGIETRK